MRKSPVFALIDCNNFFVSCERVFRPDLARTPVAVLSNNDGCVVARSNEIKQLGIKMGSPYFKDKAIYDANNATLFSANFSLYGDMSRRVHEVLRTFSPFIEMYSVDESFLEISTLGITDYQAWAQSVAQSVYTQVGIPVSVGVAPSKTLAKAAADKAKKDISNRGGYSVATDSALTPVLSREKQIDLLKWLPLQDVWGIGYRLGPRLQALGLRSAYEVTLLPKSWILTHMSIKGLRTITELQGESCIPLASTLANSGQKSLMVSRSFSESVHALHEIEIAIAGFAAKAALSLRTKKQRTWNITTFIRSSKHAPKQHYAQATRRLEIPSNDTATLIKAALKGLIEAYDRDFTYKKAGVIVTDLLSAEAAQQMSLLKPTPVSAFKRQEDLLYSIDKLNNRYGHRVVKHAIETSTDVKQRWKSKREHVSPAYTTSWQQLPLVKT